MTNTEKFKEVFGFEPDVTSLVIECPPGDVPCKWNKKSCDDKNFIYECNCQEWWQEEYKALV